jgi:hypothetical protein
VVGAQDEQAGPVEEARRLGVVDPPARLAVGSAQVAASTLVDGDSELRQLLPLAAEVLAGEELRVDVPDADGYSCR